MLAEPSGCAEDITKTKSFELLSNDPDSRLIINCGLQIDESSAYRLLTSISPWSEQISFRERTNC
jgi:hypothetical protein